MASISLETINKDLKFLKHKVLNIERAIKRIEALEFESLSKEELDFFSKVFKDSGNTDFWLNEKELKSHGINL